VWHGGERFYDWEWIQHHDRSHPAIGDVHDDLLDTQHWWLLIRRNRHIGELAFYRCYAPDAVPLRELVRVAGRRWTIEECFQTGKGIPPASCIPQLMVDPRTCLHGMGRSAARA